MHLSKAERRGKSFEEMQALRRKKWEVSRLEAVDAAINAVYGVTDEKIETA